MRVLLAGGGSGGSAAPVIAVAEELRRLDGDTEFLYVGTTTGPEARLVDEAGFSYVTVRAGRLRRFATWRNVTDPSLVLVGMGQALRVVRRFRPDVAFAAGGFASVPPLMAARTLNVPIMIHQQDVLPGLANRMLAPFARVITVAFAETRPLFRTQRTRVVGNPVRQGMLEGDPARARETFGLDDRKPVVLVTGGGTGALRLNEIVAEAAPELVQVSQVLHLTGAGKHVSGFTHPDYHPYEFLTHEMRDALAIANLVISRAGMSSLSELAALGKPSIVVPMPDSHQEANAAVMARHQAAVVLSEPELTAEVLTRQATELLDHPDRRALLSSTIADLLPKDAGRLIAEELRRRAGQPKTQANE